MSRSVRLLPTSRLEAFSDGVYAIVITLLVLELDVPHSDGDLLGELLDAWPAFLGYLVSFAFIGSSWVGHARLTPLLSASDDVFIGLNLLKLLFVSFLPFTTNLLSSHLTDAAQRPAAVLFGVDLTLAAAMGLILAGYAARAKRLVPEQNRAEVRAFARARIPGVVLMALATCFAAFLPAVAVFSYLAVSGLMLATPFLRLERLARRAHHRKGSPAAAGGSVEPGTDVVDH